ncbi:MAG: pyrophosphatase PpaX [Clostridia bacterium]|nr:pyrophosphatase PpaX [Clostridia bacterium]
MIEAVLFDFDGTLINTNDLIFASYSHAFRTVLGRDITMEEIHALYGKPLYSSLGIYGEYQDALHNAYREFNQKHHDELIQYFDKASEGVKRLKNCGYKLAVVTSKRLPTLLRGIHLLGLDNYFDALITPDDTIRHKPDPMPIFAACEKLNVRPADSVMVGDSVFDLECGKRAGTKLAAVKYSTTFDKLLEFNPDFVVDNILELAEKIIQSGGVSE